MQGGVASVAHFINGHEHELNLTESAVFFSLVPKQLTIQNLFISTAADDAPCGCRKNVSPYIVTLQLYFLVL